jgi:peptidoglycan/xylan/chitin deacetylase (PgdA/CDA1 family)
MLKPVKLAALGMLRSSGAFKLVANSRWRQERLLILCYHGTSLEDEHQWRPALYIRPQTLERRFESLKKGQFAVLPLGDALQRLHSGTLPARSVALTFDDGAYDFFRQAYPLLKHYGFPATVYQTTYYTSFERPVFNLICSYMLWMRRGEIIADGRHLGLPEPLDLRTSLTRLSVMRSLLEIASRENRTGLQKDNLAAQLAGILKIDYDELRAKRILQLMNGSELQEIVKNGIDVQLHTHRHRVPADEALFRKEIQDNRSTIHELTATRPVHFCYPSGIYHAAFLPWLREEGVVSATTCDAGLASPHSDNLLLPRFIDHENRSQSEFESWTTGVGDLLAFRRKASQKLAPVRS